MLAAIGIGFVAVATEVDELDSGAPPSELVVANARRKALAGLELAPEGAGEWSLGVDTDVVAGGRILGKAGSETEARERLEELSGRAHEVLSGVVLASAAGEPERSGLARSVVTFRDLDESLIERYLASGEWRDRAGAYAIQGLGSTLVKGLEGDFSNVVGLPLQLLLELAPELFPGISSESAE